MRVIKSTGFACFTLMTTAVLCWWRVRVKANKLRLRMPRSSTLQQKCQLPYTVYKKETDFHDWQVTQSVKRERNANLPTSRAGPSTLIRLPAGMADTATTQTRVTREPLFWYQVSFYLLISRGPYCVKQSIPPKWSPALSHSISCRLLLA